jgi:hypothetical protein
LVLPVWSVVGLAEEVRSDPYGEAVKHLQELESLLAQAEKGEKADLDKVAALVPKSRKVCLDRPGDEEGLRAWNELTARLSRTFPRTVQQLIRR